MRRKQLAKHLDKRELVGPGLLAYAAVSIASKTLHDYDSLQGAAYAP
jgi:hypothetical protein